MGQVYSSYTFKLSFDTLTGTILTVLHTEYFYFEYLNLY